jgi:hypothetical protein
MPRDPWRVAKRCAHGYPSVIASPSRLADQTPFPTLMWLTCPYLADAAAEEESSGEAATWAEAARADAQLAARLRAADRAVRDLRRAESGGEDACAGVGLAGQRDPLGVKCLHAHIAYALAGIDDPVGEAMLATWGQACSDARCDRLSEDV